MKPVKNPADHDGTQSLRDYLKHFERCSVVNGWSKEEAAVFGSLKVSGKPDKQDSIKIVSITLVHDTR